MNSIIIKISPLISKIDTTSDITILGNHFTDGGDPIVFIDSDKIEITTFTNVEIKLTIPKSLPLGMHNIKILNGEEQI